jgi:DNA mismatch repair protein MutS
LAGIPAPVLNHARHVLQALESKQSESQIQVDLFAAPASSALLDDTTSSPVDVALAAINPDNLSPREALEALYALKKIAT